MSNRISYNSIPQNGLVLDMPLNGNANARVGSNGTATNMTWLDSEKGYTSKVGSFNGTSSYVSTSGIDFFGSQPFTFSVYTKLNTLPTVNYNSIIGVNDGSIDSGIYDKAIQVLTTGQTRFYVSDTGVAKFVYGPSNISIGQYYHLLLSYNGSQAILYINGIPGIPVVINSTYNHTTPLITLSSNPGGGISRVNGQIGLVKIYNRALSTEEKHNLKLEGDRLFGDKPNYPQLLRGLKAYYDFKGGSLSNLVDGTNATNNGATLTTDHLGRANNAYSFNGSSSYINTGVISPSLFTMSVIIQTTQTTRAGIIRGEDWLQPSSVPGIFLEIGPVTPGILNYSVNDGTNYTSINSLNSVNDGQPHLITITKEASNLYKLYVDLVLQGISTVNVGVVSKPIFLGVWPDTPRFFYNGTISQLIIQNQALNASEVKELYNLTSKEYIYPFSKSSILSLEKGLVMHLDSNGVDLSGNGNNGTPTAVIPTRRGQSEGGIYNGSSSYMTVQDSVSLHLGLGDFTMLCIINVQGINSNAEILSKLVLGGSTTGFYITPSGTSTSVVGVIFNNNNASTVTTPAGFLEIGKPIKLGFIRQTISGITTLYLYKNGVLFTSAVVVNRDITNTGVLRVGGTTPTPTRYFHGETYDPIIINRALSPKEMEQSNYLNYIN